MNPANLDPSQRNDQLLRTDMRIQNLYPHCVAGAYVLGVSTGFLEAAAE
jgi:hypothetical protein